MSSNPLLPLQFPTPASLADLHEHLISDALDHLAYRPPRILVARANGADPESTSNPRAGSSSDTPCSGGGGSSSTVASFAKWDIVRPRRRRHPHASPPFPSPPTSASEPALGSRRLESGRTTADARRQLDVGDALLSHQHHHQQRAEGAEELEHGQQTESDDDEDGEEWPASANREYLAAYDSAASTERRKLMGSRPFLRESISVLSFSCRTSAL
ncbi:uncharacterized protein ColSpa_04350 [Colletotrichum spaethianum]|uniref:Uncharacterized protein n=1 Tax=Colletotrichum spaethianum TaxID=700344 RepID=A0AA37LBA4_9PEZI|nr:uncharacterized protein ColSpa_04350 [Colletotrichum spaethianum]GKT44169.1 hypothetical protein ColSpa_04350 [Colletotrichum spaethianum]